MKQLDVKGMFLILVLITLIGGKVKDLVQDEKKVKFVLDSYEIEKLEVLNIQLLK
jgi:hypothetical protein